MNLQDQGHVETVPDAKKLKCVVLSHSITTSHKNKSSSLMGMIASQGSPHKSQVVVTGNTINSGSRCSARDRVHLTLSRGDNSTVERG